MYSPDPSLPYAAFRQACRAYRPSDLLPVLAQVSARLGEPPYKTETLHGVPPWGLAAIARESLLHGNEFRDKPVTDKAVVDLCAKFNLTFEPAAMNDPDINSMNATISRIAHEQFGYQESIFEELSRSHAWFVESLPHVDTKIINNDVLADLLDMPIRDAIGATFLLTVGAWQNEGVYKPSWLDQPNFEDILELLPRENVQRTAARLTTTPEGFRKDFAAHRGANRLLDRYDYNPLVRTPFVDMGDGNPVAPATRLILRSVTPEGLYYAGMAKHGHLFANDLGLLLEHYIGRQLRLIPDAEVYPDVVYGKPERRSVDWFVVFPNLVLMVEVKSRRLIQSAKAGDKTLIPRMQEALGDARAQIETTVELVRSHHANFTHIPHDRPIIGLIVTAEPFYTGGAFLRALDPTTSGVSVGVASARDLEHLVSLDEDIAARLVEITGGGDSHGWSLGLALGSHYPTQTNPILEAAWNTYPWPENTT